ncbi:MAG: protein translocase subunit SecD [Deltaproteobacteria bacterium]|nr:protein translocase subunit SecD [Deltaproteobacteria bacterium]
MQIEEERTVGPTLGEDSIRKGYISFLVGGGLVVAFMILYYKRAGVIADLALVANIVMIMGGLAAFGATLTLPGIAGIILTLGMAVDANVIINERIREELRAGKTPRAAVDAGYDKALSAILDANITTVIAGVVLYQFGTGPIRGFAVTLMIGLVSSVFTAVVGTRLYYDHLFQRRRDLKTISI